MTGKSSKRTPNFSNYSRRRFLQGAAALAAASQASPLKAAVTNRVVAYIGAYTDKNGYALYIYDVNTSDGTLTRRTAFKGHPSPSSLAIHPQNKYLYAVNEIANYNGTTMS